MYDYLIEDINNLEITNHKLFTNVFQIVLDYNNSKDCLKENGILVSQVVDLNGRLISIKIFYEPTNSHISIVNNVNNANIIKNLKKYI